MSKTLNDLAKEFNVRKPAIYARLKKLESERPRAKLYYKRSNVLYLTAMGEKLLRANLEANPIGAKKKKRSRETVQERDQQTPAPEQDRELLEILKAQINSLESQLEAKDRTIDRLLSVVEDLNNNYSQRLFESHSLTSQEQTIKALELSQNKKE